MSIVRTGAFGVQEVNADKPNFRGERQSMVAAFAGQRRLEPSRRDAGR